MVGMNSPQTRLPGNGLITGCPRTLPWYGYWVLGIFTLPSEAGLLNWLYVARSKLAGASVGRVSNDKAGSRRRRTVRDHVPGILSVFDLSSMCGVRPRGIHEEAIGVTNELVAPGAVVQDAWVETLVDDRQQDQHRHPVTGV